MVGRSAGLTPCVCQLFCARSQRRQPGNLHGARVDVDAVDVVLDDQARHIAQEGRFGGVGSRQRAVGSGVKRVGPAWPGSGRRCSARMYACLWVVQGVDKTANQSARLRRQVQCLLSPARRPGSPGAVRSSSASPLPGAEAWESAEKAGELRLGLTPLSLPRCSTRPKPPRAAPDSSGRTTPSRGNAFVI